jgi:hypothetical protein
MLTQLNSMFIGMVMFIADMASGTVMWLTMTASVVTASCDDTDVSIEAPRKFFSADAVMNGLRRMLLSFCFLLFIATCRCLR